MWGFKTLPPASRLRRRPPWSPHGGRSPPSGGGTPVSGLFFLWAEARRSEIPAYLPRMTHDETQDLSEPAPRRSRGRDGPERSPDREKAVRPKAGFRVLGLGVAEGRTTRRLARDGANPAGGRFQASIFPHAGFALFLSPFATQPNSSTRGRSPWEIPAILSHNVEGWTAGEQTFLRTRSMH